MEAAHKERDKNAIVHLLETTLPALAAYLQQDLAKITPLFHDFRLEKVVDTWTKPAGADEDTPISIEAGNVQQVGLRLQLEGFQGAGAPPFDLSKMLLFKLGQAQYTVGPDRAIDWLEKPYYQPWSEKEKQDISTRWIAQVLDEITQHLEGL